MSSDKKYTSIHYASYLQLDKILSAQNTRSKELGAEAHEETLFIIIHQVYELWFKQMIHEIDSKMKSLYMHLNFWCKRDALNLKIIIIFILLTMLNFGQMIFLVKLMM